MLEQVLDVERHGFLGVLRSLKLGLLKAQWLWKQLRLVSSQCVIIESEQRVDLLDGAAADPVVAALKHSWLSMVRIYSASSSPDQLVDTR